MHGLCTVYDSGFAGMTQVALASAMRNEGPFLIEWIAYHQVIGMGPIFIATNDCTDGSDQLLDRLAQAGEITHFDNPTHPGQAPQDGAMQQVFKALEDSEVEWLSHIDSDEFIHIKHGDGTISELMRLCAEADVIGLPWRMFGDNGHTQRTLPILPNFTACEGAPNPKTAKFKSIFRHRLFEHAEDHRPVRPKRDRLRVVNAAGQPLKDNFHNDRKWRKYMPLDRAIVPEACINHYAIRAREDFLMKNDRGDGQGHISGKYHLGSKWHTTCNQNAQSDQAILRHWPATEANMTRLRRLPGIAAAEAHCLERDAAQRAIVLTPDNLERWGARRLHATSKET